MWGYFGYESANYMGTLRELLPEPSDENLIGFFEVDEFYVFDNRMGRIYAACSVPLKGDAEEAYAKAVKRTEAMAGELHGLNFDSHDSGMADPVKEFEQPEYMELVEKLRGEIIEGEAIQVVLSNRFEIKAKVNPVSFYRRCEM
ncbi:MAG: hypothetical protein LRY51_10010 [Geovibrio sp.]|nr:hypothetical protein [Geovibrio sp.]